MTTELTHYRGTTFAKTVTLDEPASFYELYRFTGRFRIPVRTAATADAENDPNVIFALTSEPDGGIVASGSTLVITIDAADALEWPDLVYWDIKGITSAGFVGPVDDGTIEVTGDVTRDVGLTGP